MFNQNIQMVDIDPDHWTNLVRLVRGDLFSKGSSGPRKIRPPTLRMILEDGQVLKAMHGEKGRLFDCRPPAPDDLDGFIEREGLGSVTLIEHGAIRNLMHLVQSRLSLEMNFFDQLLCIYGAIREEMREGGIRVHPRPRLPDVKSNAVSTIIKAVLPPGELMVLVVYSDGDDIRDSSGLPIVTSILLRLNDRSEIDLLTTTDSLITAGLSISGWRDDYKRINELAAEVWKSKVFTGLHVPLSSMPALMKAFMNNQGPKAMQNMRKAGELILDPYPLRLKAMLKMGGLMKR